MWILREHGPPNCDGFFGGNPFSALPTVVGTRFKEFIVVPNDKHQYSRNAGRAGVLAVAGVAAAFAMQLLRVFPQTQSLSCCIFRVFLSRT